MKESQSSHILNIVSRWIVGLVFIFSGFVKGVDPMGTSFKVHEYMTAWSIGSFTFEWATPLATPLAVALVTLEFTIGIMLIMRCGSILGVGYEKVYLMQSDLNLSTSEIISTYIYKTGIGKGEFSFGAAVDLFNSVINCILLVTVNKISKLASHDEVSLF